MRAWRVTWFGTTGIYLAPSRGRATMAVVSSLRDCGLARRGWPKGLRVVRAPEFDALAEEEEAKDVRCLSFDDATYWLAQVRATLRDSERLGVE